MTPFRLRLIRWLCPPGWRVVKVGELPGLPKGFHLHRNPVFKERKKEKNHVL